MAKENSQFSLNVRLLNGKYNFLFPFLPCWITDNTFQRHTGEQLNVVRCFDDYLTIFIQQTECLSGMNAVEVRKTSFAAFFPRKWIHFTLISIEKWCIQTNENRWIIQWISVFYALLSLMQTIFEWRIFDDFPENDRHWPLSILRLRVMRCKQK